jgi:hypothetical protein
MEISSHQRLEYLKSHEYGRRIFGRVTNMRNMFYRATEFNIDIGHWDVSQVMEMSGIFDGAIQFDRDLSRWDM